MACKDCAYFKDNGICTLKHIRTKKNTENCSTFKQIEQIKDTRSCATCKYAYFPDKTYKNYSLYINYKGEFFMCKCKLDKWAKFLTEKCKKYGNRESND